MSSTAVNSLTQLLDASAATEEFKQAVRDMGAGRPTDLVRFKRGAPPVKVLRTISKLLEVEPTLPIADVDIDAFSGCSNFSGKLTVNGGEAEFSFNWDCAWRAREEGFRDYWGNPDQARAAQEFGYQCFQMFRRTK